VKVSVIVGNWETLLTPNFVKIDEGDIPFWGKYIPKITNFSDFSGCKPTFISQSSKIWRGCVPGTPSPSQATRCPDKRATFTFIAAEMWEYSPKTDKISNFGHKFAPQGSLVSQIFTKFSDFVRVSKWILSFYFGCFLNANK